MERLAMGESAKGISSKSPVTIKGVRDGLLFILQEDVTFDEILTALKAKLTGSHKNLLMGPIVHVWIVIGHRQLLEEQEQQIRDSLAVHGNLVIQGFIQEDERFKDKHADKGPLMYKGTVRSGQILRHEGDVMVIGDVNHGGQVIATGDVYVMGTLRGIAHAGSSGDTRAVVAAVYFQPTQLRIGDIFSRAPDVKADRLFGKTEMEFAYVKDGHMAVDRMTYLNIVRNR